MQADIEELRGQVDVLIVALHKGLGHTPATLAMYERPLSKAAVDAEADIVVGHHAHILQGVEIYKGKPIYHGLGNFVTVSRALSVDDNPSPARLKWSRRRRELFGFEPDPHYPNYPFRPQAKNAMIASCRIHEDGCIDAGFLPCWVQPSGQPDLLGIGQRELLRLGESLYLRGFRSHGARDEADLTARILNGLDQRFSPPAQADNGGIN